MATISRIQNRYDHKLKELVQSTNDIRHAVRHGVPSSTARGWMKAPPTEVVTIEVPDTDTIQLQQKVLKPNAQITRPTATPLRSFSEAEHHLLSATQATTTDTVLQEIGLQSHPTFMTLPIK